MGKDIGVALVFKAVCAHYTADSLIRVVSRKEMSQTKDAETSGSLGYQKKNNEEVDEIVKRLNTPKRQKTPKEPGRRKKARIMSLHAYNTCSLFAE